MVQRIVLIGGPGAGKTTVLDVLRGRGHAVGDDAARSIIRERVSKGLAPRPEPREFASQTLAREIEAFRSACSSPTFFERGVADAAGMCFGAGEIDEDRARRLVDEYRYDHAFLFPAWEDIYETDAERDHTFEHAVQVCESTRNWYLRNGYEVIEVPLVTAKARAEFILRHIPHA